MKFVTNLSKINKLVFLFGISPYSLNAKTNKFECSVHTLIYTFVYFLSISIAIIYMAFAYYLQDGHLIQSTFMILTFLQQATVMIIFYSTMLDLMLKRQRHVHFLNSLVELDSKLASKFYANNNDSANDLLSLHKYHIVVVCFYAAVNLLNSILYINRMQLFEHVWNTMQFCQTMSLTLVGYYIRCFAIVLHHRCSPIFRRLDSIGNDLRYADNNPDGITELMNYFEAFDEIMDLKNQLSSIFGIQLLLNSAFDFIILTISVYGLLYFQTKDLSILYYLVAYNLPHAIKGVLLVLALDTLANQISLLRQSVLKVSYDPHKNKLSELMDLMFLKINHMEKTKYVTASDFYPINRSMMYGMAAAIVTHMMVIFQFQQWEDSQPNAKQLNISSFY